MMSGLDSVAHRNTLEGKVKNSRKARVGKPNAKQPGPQQRISCNSHRPRVLTRYAVETSVASNIRTKFEA